MNTFYDKQERFFMPVRLAMRFRIPVFMIMVRGEMSLSSIRPPQCLQGE